MSIPLQITFKGMDPSPALEARVREQAARLERFAGRIRHCHITMEAPHRHQHQGRLYRARIALDVPGAEIVIGHEGPKDPAHEDAFVALRDAFDAATRRLEDHVRRRRGQMKQHEEVFTPGRIKRFVAGEDYGFIETGDGQEVYFHRNSVADGGFDRLHVGDQVRVAVAEGESGPQASAVHPAGQGQ